MTRAEAPATERAWTKKARYETRSLLTDAQEELGDALAEMAEKRAGRGFTFRDLVIVGAPRHSPLSELIEWLAEARTSGFLTDLPFDNGLNGTTKGAHRYRIADPAPVWSAEGA